jgi:hypothetical protein
VPAANFGALPAPLPAATTHAERERAAAAVKTWLLAEIEIKRAAPASDMVEAASNESFAPERLAA